MINCFPITSSFMLHIIKKLFLFKFTDALIFHLLFKTEKTASLSIKKDRFFFSAPARAAQGKKPARYKTSGKFFPFFPEQLKKSGFINFAVLLAITPLLFFGMTGCVKEQSSLPALKKETASQKIRIFTSGSLKLKNPGGKSATLYIEEVNARGASIDVSQEMIRAMSHHFTVVNSPKEAAFILHMNILGEGPCSAAILEQLVNDGFAARGSFSGTGENAMLADALLVNRRVPSESREQKANIAHASLRHALDSAKMRIGVAIAGTQSRNIHQELATALINELEKNI